MEQKIKEQIKSELARFEKNDLSAERARGEKLLKRYLGVFALAFLLLLSFYVGFLKGKKSGSLETGKETFLTESLISNKLPDQDKNVDFSLFWKVWDLLKEKYVDRNSLISENLIYGAIKGMLKATNDPYSNFFDPKETRQFGEQIGGSFEGIGAELGIKNNTLTVIAPLSNSPAEKAGLRAADKILEINEKITTDMTVEEAVDLIRGKKGTLVKLTILHDGAEESQEISIVRDTIKMESVKWEIKNDQIVYIKINEFGEDTSEDFRSAIQEIGTKNPKGIILDLRNNPGGFVDSAVEIASYFLPKGQVVVTEEGLEGKKDSLTTLGGDSLSQIPLIVIINEGSASASEILSGALRDDRGVQIIGKKSFGKGSVQEYMKLSGGTSVKITVAKWLTPKGDYIMEKGITPDKEVDYTIDDLNAKRDPQLDTALESLKAVIK